MSKVKKKKLTLKEEKLVSEYVKTGNKRQSAIKAGYSPRSADAIANETLNKPKVQAAIQTATEKLGINAEYVLGNLKEIAEFNKKPIIRSKLIGGNVFQEEEMIDPHAAIRSTELLGKNLNLFIEKLEVTGKDGKDLIPEEEKQKNLAKKIALLLSSASSE